MVLVQVVMYDKLDRQHAFSLKMGNDHHSKNMSQSCYAVQLNMN